MNSQSPICPNNTIRTLTRSMDLHPELQRCHNTGAVQVESESMHGHMEDLYELLVPFIHGEPRLSEFFNDALTPALCFFALMLYPAKTKACDRKKASPVPW